MRAHANKRPGVDGTDTSGAKAEKAQRKEDNTIIAAGGESFSPAPPNLSLLFPPTGRIRCRHFPCDLPMHEK